MYSSSVWSCADSRMTTCSFIESWSSVNYIWWTCWLFLEGIPCPTIIYPHTLVSKVSKLPSLKFSPISVGYVRMLFITDQSDLSQTRELCLSIPQALFLEFEGFLLISVLIHGLIKTLRFKKLLFKVDLPFCFIHLNKHSLVRQLHMYQQWGWFNEANTVRQHQVRHSEAASSQPQWGWYNESASAGNHW